MDKPIPEAVAQLRRLAGVIRRHGTIPSLSLEHIADALTAAQQPDHIVDATKMVAQQQRQAVALDRMAIRLLVAAGFVTEDKANEALRIAHGFDKGPLAPQSAPVGVEEMQRRLDREDSDHGRTIDQRDAAEDALSRMFRAVTGRDAEWSSAWGFVDAVEEVEEHVAALAQQPAAVDELPDCPHSALDGCDCYATQHQEPTTHG